MLLKDKKLFIRKKKNIFFNIIVLVSCILIINFKVNAEELSIEEDSIIKNSTSSYSWIRDNPVIAHGLGGIDDKRVTNSLEALQKNYKKGIRVFEADLILTKDNYLVSRHDWGANLSDVFLQNICEENKGKPLTLKEFKSQLIYKKYTPLDFTDIARFLKEHKDVYLVTDTKGISEKEVKRSFNILVQTAKSIDESILHRIIPQIYNQEMLSWIKSIYPFKDIIYTLYMSSDSDDEVIDFVAKNNIQVVTMSEDRCSEAFIKTLSSIPSIKVYTYVHTINETEKIKKYLDIGVYGFYSDFLNNSDVIEIKYKIKK